MHRYRNFLIAFVLLVAAGGLGYYLYRAEKVRLLSLNESETETLDPTATALSGEGGSVPVKIYTYRGGRIEPNDGFLAMQERKIVQTNDPILNARQVITEVLKNNAAFPANATLRQVYVLDDGTAVVDLPSQALEQIPGGVVSEMGAILSVTRSLRANIPEIKRVRFLIDGEPRSTFAGHVSIRDPFM